jgi:hypothetical protein
MKRIGIVLILIFSFLFVSACQSSQPPKTPVDTPPDRAEVFEFVQNAQKNERSFYAGKYTQEQVYEYFQSYYTKDYIDKIILGGGNIKLVEGYWTLANIGSEYIEGTYFSGDFNDTTEVQYINDKTIKVLQAYGDGLYAPHNENITLVKTEKGWLIDQLEWVYNKY